MLHMIVGIIAIVMGLWGIASNWYMLRDILLAMAPVVVILFGVVALLAGIRSVRQK